MRNLILGIITVIFLDIGFVGYTAVERTAETPIPAIGHPVDQQPLLASLGSENAIPQYEIAATTAETGENFRIVRTAFVRQRGETRPALLARNNSANTDMRPIVITYPARKPIEFRSTAPKIDRTPKTAKVERTVEKKKENRSFVAAALPIIKKPYDWLKAIGEKLR